MLCYLNMNRPETIHKSVKFRAFRNIPVPDYRNDVKLPMCNQRSKDNPKALFRLTRNMMGNSGETILPFHTCKRNIANDFSAFFTAKY